MGLKTKIILLTALGLTAWFLLLGGSPGELPQLDPEEWWGPKDLIGRQDQSIRSFKIKFEEEVIKDLKRRLKSRRALTPPLQGVAFQYGFNTNHLDPWLKYWAEEYPFAAREKFLNQFPQFKTNIQGLDVHFIRVRPQVPKGVEIVPLLLMHGWPGSVREFYEAIPLLTKQTSGYDFAFEVIAPSIPGYGFSDPAVRPGLGAPQVAVIFKNLMNRLGYKKYFTQGGDWGAEIGSAMATLYPDVILGHHTSMAMTQNKNGLFKLIFGAFFPSLVVEQHLADRIYPLSNFFEFLMEEFGYMHLQITKPDTIGVPLADSPAGFLAYILEKFSAWTRRDNKFKPDGNLGFRFTKDQLIDNLMIYWISNSITTSMRLYAESMNKKTLELNLEAFSTPVPTWALQAKYENFYQPPSVLRTKFPNLLNTTALDDGGHFLAFELPEVFVEDVFRAVKAFREWKRNQKNEL